MATPLALYSANTAKCQAECVYVFVISCHRYCVRIVCKLFTLWQIRSFYKTLAGQILTHHYICFLTVDTQTTARKTFRNRWTVSRMKSLPRVNWRIFGVFACNLNLFYSSTTELQGNNLFVFCLIIPDKCLCCNVQMLRVKVAVCDQWRSCSDCLGAGDAYCGWCTLQNR